MRSAGELYSLRLTCSAVEVDSLSSELWEAGTVGIEELPCAEGVRLTATFDGSTEPRDLSRRFFRYSPEWKREPRLDWTRLTHDAWPARTVGERLFLAPAWNNDPTPNGRERVVHNPGLACGTGEHPCTQLALRALDRCVTVGSRVVDIGTGSGILAIAALRLGAVAAIGFDLDQGALQVARENFSLNRLAGLLVAGSTDTISDTSADITVANLNGTVLVPMLDELRRITRREGHLILTGFTASELPGVQSNIAKAIVSGMDEWCCIVSAAF